MGPTGERRRAEAFISLWLAFVVVVLASTTVLAKVQLQQDGFQEVTDHKDLKKLMKTKNNLMLVLSEAKLDGKTQEMLTKVKKDGTTK